MSIWQLCANLLIPNCLRSNLSYSPLAALELYVKNTRTMLFIEESVKNAAKAYVFEPNVSNTWLNMKSMIGSFLNGVWKQGGLAGSVPEDAYSVQVGLGETMTQDDVLNGIMRITVLVAITRPAEFIEITFQQQVQKS